VEAALASYWYYTPLAITVNALGKLNVPTPVSDFKHTTARVVCG
jgi:hypothetical protein